MKKITLANRILKLIETHKALSTTDLYRLTNKKYSFNHIGVVGKKLVVKNKLVCFRTKFFNNSYIYAKSYGLALNYLSKNNLLPEFARAFLYQLYQKGFITSLELKDIGLTKFHFKILDRLFVKRNPIFKKFDYNNEIGIYYPKENQNQLKLYLNTTFKNTFEKYAKKKAELTDQGQYWERKLGKLLESYGWEVHYQKTFKDKNIYRRVDVFAVKTLDFGIKEFIFAEIKSGSYGMLTIYDILSLDMVRKKWFKGNGWILGLSTENKISNSLFRVMPERTQIWSFKKFKDLCKEKGIKLGIRAREHKVMV